MAGGLHAPALCQPQGFLDPLPGLWPLAGPPLPSLEVASWQAALAPSPSRDAPASSWLGALPKPGQQVVGLTQPPPSHPRSPPPRPSLPFISGESHPLLSQATSWGPEGRGGSLGHTNVPISLLPGGAPGAPCPPPQCPPQGTALSQARFLNHSVPTPALTGAGCRTWVHPPDVHLRPQSSVHQRHMPDDSD